MEGVTTERSTAKTVLVVNVPTLKYKDQNNTMENCILVPKPINSYSEKAKMFHSEQCHIFKQLEDQLAKQ